MIFDILLKIGLQRNAWQRIAITALLLSFIIGCWWIFLGKEVWKQYRAINHMSASITLGTHDSIKQKTTKKQLTAADLFVLAHKVNVNINTYDEESSDPIILQGDASQIRTLIDILASEYIVSHCVKIKENQLEIHLHSCDNK